VRCGARYLHYRLSTEKLYVYWARFFVRWHWMKHPRDMGAPEVEAFLTMLATERKLSALLFLCREVLPSRFRAGAGQRFSQAALRLFDHARTTNNTSQTTVRSVMA